MSDFDRFKALSFDCYGTLIDWENGILQALEGWSTRNRIADDHLLTWMSQIETVVQGETPTLPYPRVLAETLRRIGELAGAEVTEADATAFGSSVGSWPAFDDSVGALARLARTYKLIIVSNVDRSSFAASSRQLGVAFDGIITAEDVGSYKPSMAHFEALLATLPALEVGSDELLHVAQSLYHDHEPAARLRLPSVWIDRHRGKEGSGATPAPTDAKVAPRWRFSSLAAFADEVDRS